MNVNNFLKAQIVEAANAYYSSGLPIMSDAAFDHRVEEYRKLCPDDEIFKLPGFGVTDVPFQQITREHSIFVGGLDQIKSQDITDDTFLDSHQSIKTGVISEKLDGISCVLYYLNGDFSHALTRHDGLIGVDITSKVKHLNIPKSINPDIKWVRGELVMHNDKFDSEKWRNQRNAVSGLMASQEPDTEDLLRVHFVAYNADIDAMMHYVLDDLSKEGFEVVKFILCQLTANNVLNEWSLEVMRKNSSYLLDGTVVVTSDYQSYKIKFPAEEAQTTVTEVEWNVSGHGRVIPTVLFNTVDISGADISAASGFNAKFIIDNKIGVGAEIIVSRRNEVIPHIESVVTPAEDLNIPTEIEGNAVFLDGVHLMTFIDKEPGIISDIITDWGPKGLGGGRTHDFVVANGIDANKLIHLIADINSLDGILDMEYVFSQKIKEAISSVATLPTTLSEVISYLKISGVGPNISENMAAVVKTLDAFKIVLTTVMGDKEATSDTIEGLKAVMPGYTWENMVEQAELSLKILNIPFNITAPVLPESKSESQEGAIPYCMTGSFQVFKSVISANLSVLGFVEKSVNEASFLISDTSTRSGKVKDAMARGIPVLTLSEFCSKHNISYKSIVGVN